MKTLEEILDQHQPSREYPSYYHESNVLEAMEEYAAQFRPQWIEINSEADLPKEDTPCYFMDKKDGVVIGTFLKIGDIDFILKNATHYAHITKPQPPKED